MSLTAAVVTKLTRMMAVQIELNELAINLGAERVLAEQFRCGMQDSRHNRDQHRGFWDVDGAIADQAAQRERLEEATQAFSAKQAELKQIFEELEVIVTRHSLVRGVRI